MTYRDFININTAAGTSKTAKEYVISAFVSPTAVSIYPPNMDYPEVRNNIKLYELPQLMSEIKRKKIHICNPETLANTDLSWVVFK